MGATVVGVSKDSVESHDAFVNDLSLNFPLISDDGTLCEAFGVWKVRFALFCFLSVTLMMRFANANFALFTTFAAAQAWR